MSREVMTVRGPVSPGELGHTQVHEHVFADLSWPRHRWLAIPMTDEVQMTEEVRLYKEAGGGTLVDPTLEHIGRDPEKLRRVSEASDVHIVMGTGFYREPYYPEFVNKWTTQRLADYMIDEIENGVGDTGIKPGIIGEIGLDKTWVQGVEERVLRAAARAQVATGLALTTHTTMYMALEFLEIFQEEGVPMDRVAIGHSADTTDVEYLEDLLKAGVYLSMDRYPGRPGRANWEERNASVKELIARGWADKIMLGHDGTTPLLRVGETEIAHDPTGPNGWTFLSTTALPALLADGLPQETIDLMMIEVPRRFLTGES